MKITTRISWDWEGRLVEHDWFEYDGEVEFLKGASTADSQRQTELGMQQQAFNTQQQQLAMLNKSLSPYLAGKTGFDPSMLASMRSQFLNQNSSTFNQAGNQVRSALGARGEGTGSAPVGGTYGSGISNLMAAQAGSQSQGLLGINVQNAQQALQNQFNAANVLSGNAATLTGTQGVAGAGASSALGSYIQGENTGPLNTLAGAFGGALGSGLGFGVGGGLGQAIAKGCWIAEATWGVNDWRTHIVRFWLNFDFGQRWYGRPVMSLYLKYGRWISRHPKIVKLLRPLFDLALEKATK